MSIDFVTQLREGIAGRVASEIDTNRKLQPHMFKDAATLVEDINKAEAFLLGCRDFINNDKLFNDYPPSLKDFK
ncbi:hypothetical protein [Methylotenera sp.]|uniref:hypothetical protein n=1 Tax=Methylotenera sp. TaxID=2051956 RepID=UPI0024884A05|nr:hypothetical protein [Methylotenera sp.]MDI1362542.1 hypothetical protein [Methylotenera sp.]